jgi:hypothetical protein
MRTTVTLEPDVVAELERLRREKGLGPSEAVNFLVRQGMRVKPERKPFVNMSDALGAKIDVANVGEVLDLLDQYDAEDRARAAQERTLNQ